MFVAWIGDHAPYHVHVYRDGSLKLKWDLENRRPMAGRPTRRILRLIEELRREGFTYVLEDGSEATVPVDAVLDYNRDPGYLRDLLVYRLTLEAERRVTASELSVREIARRLSTSPTQLYRLLDPTFYGKTIDRLVELLTVLGCTVKLDVSDEAPDPM